MDSEARDNHKEPVGPPEGSLEDFGGREQELLWALFTVSKTGLPWTVSKEIFTFQRLTCYCLYVVLLLKNLPKLVKSYAILKRKLKAA